MSTFHIPDDLVTTPGHELPAGVNVINYCSRAQAIVQSKVILKHHLFSLLVEGWKSVSHAGKRVQIGSDQFLLLSAGHYLMTEKTASAEGYYKGMLLFFDAQTLADFFIKYPAVLSTTGSHQPEPFLVFTKDNFLKNFIASLQMMTENGGSIARELLQVKYEELMLYLCQQYPQQVLSLRAAALATPAETEIRRLAEAHIESSTSVEELAFLCHMSLSTFKRRFIGIYGLPPSKWFLQKRMERAAALLCSGCNKPSDVYYKVGYESHSSFAHSFKQVFGVTPSEYQQAGAIKSPAALVDTSAAGR